MTKHSHDRLEIVFAPLADEPKSTAVVLASDGATLGKTAAELDKRSGGAVHRAAKAAGFKGKSKAVIELLAPHGLETDRLIMLGTGKDQSELDWTLLGGAAVGAISGRKTKSASLIADVTATGELKPAEMAAALGFGAQLRHYSFTKYLTKKDANGEDKDKDNTTLRQKMSAAVRPDGTKVYNVATGLSLLVFYVLAMQCMSTLAVVKRETRCWKWPIIQLVYMTGLAYVMSLIAYQLLK